jgi:LysM repeat protein
MTVQSKLAWRYFGAAILLFAIGYGAAFGSEKFQGSLSDTPAPANQAQSKPSAAPGNDKTQKQPGQNSGESYTVQPGDTVSIIAGAKGTTVEELAEFNNISIPYTITAGQTLKIPPKK